MQYVCKDPEDLAITMLVRVEGPRIGDLLYVWTSTSATSLTVVDVQRKGDLVTLTLKGEDDGT